MRSARVNSLSVPGAGSWPWIGWGLCLAGLALLANGYTFPSADQDIHLTFLLQQMDPNALSGDLVAQHAPHHISAWWLLHAPVVQLLGWSVLSPLYFALWILSLTATFLVLTELACTLFSRSWPAFLAPAALIVFKFAPGHLHTFEPELINRTLAHPLLLAALVAMLKDKPVIASVLWCVALPLHPTSAVQTACVLIPGALMCSDLRRAGLGMAGGLLVATAGVLVFTDAQSLTWVDPEWMTWITWRLGHHLVPFRWPAGLWAMATLQLLLFVSMRNTVPSRQHRRLLLGIVLGVALCALVGTVGCTVLPLAGLLQLHLWQAWIWLTLLAVLMASHGLLHRLSQGSHGARLLWLLLFLTLCMWTGREGLGMNRRPAHFHFGLDADQHHLIDALDRISAQDCPRCPVLVSPDMRPWLRPWGRRALVVTTKDGGEILYSRSFATEWTHRLDALCGVNPSRINLQTAHWLGYQATRSTVKTSFQSLSPEELVQRGLSLGARIAILSPSQNTENLPILYQNSRYTIVSLQ